jgi:methanogenic corrinoid protein MtbC1
MTTPDDSTIIHRISYPPGKRGASIETPIGIWNCVEGEVHTYGSGMVGMTVAMGPDHCLELFCERDAVDMVQNAMVELLSDAGWECR